MKNTHDQYSLSVQCLQKCRPQPVDVPVGNGALLATFTQQPAFNAAAGVCALQGRGSKPKQRSTPQCVWSPEAGWSLIQASRREVCDHDNLCDDTQWPPCNVG